MIALMLSALMMLTLVVAFVLLTFVMMTAFVIASLMVAIATSVFTLLFSSWLKRFDCGCRRQDWLPEDFDWRPSVDSQRSSNH